MGMHFAVVLADSWLFVLKGLLDNSFPLHHWVEIDGADAAHQWVLLKIRPCLHPVNRKDQASLPTMQGVSSVQSRNVLSSARIHSGLAMCETSGGTAKETYDLLPSRSMVSMCPWNGRGHDPDLGVGHCQALTCKMTLLPQVHFWAMGHACLHLMWWCLTDRLSHLHTKNNQIGHQIEEVPLESSWYLVWNQSCWRRRLQALHMFGSEVVLRPNPGWD